jgi:hypothetical protein
LLPKRHAVKDCEHLMGANNSNDFKEGAIGSWTNNEYSVCSIGLSNCVQRDEVFDGMPDVIARLAMFESRLENVNMAIS